MILVIFYLYELLIFARCILSFLPFYNRLTEWVYMATEPILKPCRKLTDKFNINLPIDFSPLVAILLMRLIQEIFIRIVFLIVL
ncbi:MAG: YggT family protein [Clostridia bacterium]|nr:YggT family protein [Clostridia bacterium]